MFLEILIFELFSMLLGIVLLFYMFLEMSGYKYNISNFGHSGLVTCCDSKNDIR